MIVKSSSTKVLIVPAVEEIAREMTSSSQIVIMLRRLRQLSIQQVLTLAINNLGYLLVLAKRDFAAGIKLLAELEVVKANKLGRRKIALHSQMVDMSVALGNWQLLSYYLDLANRYQFVPVLMTHNPLPLVTILSRLKKLPNDLLIMTPLDRQYLPSKFIRETHLRFANWNG